MRKIFWLVVLGLTWAMAANAAPAEVELTVDVTAENAAIAREKAMNQATRRAVYNTAAAFTGADGLAILRKMNNEQLLNFISETTVMQEKASAVRYMARLKLLIDVKLLKQYLQEKNAMLSAMPLPEIFLITPYYNPAPVLWEESNLWRRKWQTYGEHNGLGKIHLLPASAADLIGADNAAHPTAETLQKLSSRLGSNIVYAASATAVGPKLEIKLQNLTTGNAKEMAFDIAENGEIPDTVIVEVMEEILQEQNINQATLSSQAESIGVLSSISGLRQWLAIEEKISNLNVVEDLRLVAAGNDKIQFQLDFVGGLYNLNSALRQIGLQLQENGNIYLLLPVEENIQ